MLTLTEKFNTQGGWLIKKSTGGDCPVNISEAPITYSLEKWACGVG